MPGWVPSASYRASSRDSSRRRCRSSASTARAPLNTFRVRRKYSGPAPEFADAIQPRLHLTARILQSFGRHGGRKHAGDLRVERGAFALGLMDLQPPGLRHARASSPHASRAAVRQRCQRAPKSVVRANSPCSRLTASVVSSPRASQGSGPSGRSCIFSDSKFSVSSSNSVLQARPVFAGDVEHRAFRHLGFRVRYREDRQ